jgi:hypothetical protein
MAATTGFGMSATAAKFAVHRRGSGCHLGIAEVDHLRDDVAGGCGRGADRGLDLSIQRVQLRPVDAQRCDAVGDFEAYVIAHGQSLAHWTSFCRLVDG